MRISDFIQEHSQDIEFYSVNGSAVAGAFLIPWMEELKEVLGVLVLLSVLAYNYYRIRNERIKGKEEKKNKKGGD